MCGAQVLDGEKAITCLAFLNAVDVKECYVVLRYDRSLGVAQLSIRPPVSLWGLLGCCFLVVGKRQVTSGDTEWLPRLRAGHVHLDKPFHSFMMT